MKVHKSKYPKPGKAEFTVVGACCECMCMGWNLYNDDVEVQRCDTCKVFADDDDALAYALLLAHSALKNPKKRTGKRFKEVLLALEVAAKRISPPFWTNGYPNPDWLKQFVHGIYSWDPSRKGVTSLEIAYRLQDNGFIYQPSKDDIGMNYRFIRNYLNREELESILRRAKCKEVSDGLWL